MTTPTAPPLDADLERLLRRMRLPHIRRVAPEVLATAKAQRWDPAEVLKALLREEVAGRDRSALATRRARAAFPTGKTFHAWDPHLSSIPAPTQQALRTLEWIHRKENLVLCGPSGTAVLVSRWAVAVPRNRSGVSRLGAVVPHGGHGAGLLRRVGGCEFGDVRGDGEAVGLSRHHGACCWPGL